MTRRQRTELRYNAAQIAEFERVTLTKADYDNIIDEAEEIFNSTGHYDYEICYDIVVKYMHIFS